MYCINCGKEQPEGSKFCYNCGYVVGAQIKGDISTPTTKLKKIPDTMPSPNKEKILYFYSIPVSKYVLLVIATFGLYDLFWFARNFGEIQKQEHSNIWPIARAIFAVLFYSELARKVLNSAKANGYQESYNPTTLNIFYFITSLFGRFSGYFWMLGFTSIFTIMPTINAMRYNNEKIGHEVKTKYSAGEIITLVLGACVWVLVLFGMLITLSES